jgi:hypothetical protein
MTVNYVPGGTTALVKGELASTEGDKTKVAFYFNPKEITIDKPVPWQKHKNVEGDAPTLEFTAAEPKTLACELMFDMFEERGDVHAKYISNLEKMALVNDSVKRPPLLTFTWGSNFPVFKGVIEDLNVKYTLFLPDGTPCRATVQLKMKQANKLLNKKEAEAANKKAEQAQGTTTQGGERADQVAENSGHGAENTREMASQNNIDNPNNIPAGTNVQGPPRR